MEERIVSPLDQEDDFIDKSNYPLTNIMQLINISHKSDKKTIK